MDLDLRKLRYFVAVADRLHFGRAAEDLHIAQPALSRQIRALEDDLAVQLFRRDRRTTELTPAGARLLPEARSLLGAAAALRRRVERAADGEPSFRIGFMPGITVTAVSRALRARHPSLIVDALRTSWADQCEVVRDGRADVSFVRLPADGDGLTLSPLFAEPRVVVMAAEHRLAGKDSVRLAELTGERLIQDPAAVPEWKGLTEPVERGEGPLAVEEKLELVASAMGVVVLPLSTAASYTRPDVRRAVIEDIGPGQVCLASLKGDTSPLVTEVAALAHEAYAADAAEASQPTR